MKKSLFLIAVMLAAIQGFCQTSTQPPGWEATAFRNANLPVTMIMPSAYTIPSLNLEVWNNGVKLSDSTDVTVSGDTVRFTLTKAQIAPFTKESYAYLTTVVGLDTLYLLGVKITVKSGIATPITGIKTINLPNVGNVRVSVVGDATMALQAATAAQNSATTAIAARDAALATVSGINATVLSRVKYGTRAQLRANTDIISVFEVVEGNVSGTFRYNPADVVSADDGVMCIVSGTKRYQRQYEGPVNLGWWITPDYNSTTKVGTNHFYTLYAIVFPFYKNIHIPKGKYLTAIFPKCDDCVITGEPGTTFYTHQISGSSAVSVQFGDNTVVRNVNFICDEPDLENSRSAIENVENVTIENCSFSDFKNPTEVNSWGVYISNSKNVTLSNCTFSGNTQADIAVLEGAENIAINNAMSTAGVILNFEPNYGEIKNVTVTGGTFSNVYLLENSYTEYGGLNIGFAGSKIDSLFYDGADVDFSGCEIGAINPIDNADNYAGELSVKMNLSPNLITDPKITDVMNGGSGTYWTNNGFLNLYDLSHVTTVDGSYTRINPGAAANQFSIATRNYITITGGPLLVFCHSRAVITTGGGFIGKNLRIEYFNSSNVSLLVQDVIINRGLANTTTPFKSHFAISNPPATAVKCKVYFGNINYSTTTQDVKAIGLYEIRNLKGGVDINYAVQKEL